MKNKGGGGAGKQFDLHVYGFLGLVLFIQLESWSVCGSVASGKKALILILRRES